MRKQNVYIFDSKLHPSADHQIRRFKLLIIWIIDFKSYVYAYQKILEHKHFYEGRNENS